MAPPRISVVRSLAVLGLVAAAVPALRAQDRSGERAQKAEAIKADLLKLSELERTWYTQHNGYTVDLKALGFKPLADARLTMSYASAHAWSANETHPAIEPVACFVIVAAAPSGLSDADKPFCRDTRVGTAAKELAKAGPAEAPSQTAAPAQQPAPAPQKAALSQRPAPSAQKTAAAPPTAPAVTSKLSAAKTVPSPARQTAKASAKRRADRARQLVAPTMPAQGDVAAAARSQTRNASPVRSAGAPEAVNTAAFTERLSAIVAGAREVLATRPPELPRDPYESSAEYAARRAQAMALYDRREDDYFAKNSRTFLVQIAGKDAKYDPDREILDINLDGVTLPVTRDLGVPQLGVTCYTRPVFWCSPDAGLTYEATGLWHVARARARELDVLRAPIAVQARFVVGRRDDRHEAAVTLVGLELQARGQTLAKWDVAAETR